MASACPRGFTRRSSSRCSNAEGRRGLPFLSLERLDDLLRALVGVIVVDDEDGVDHPREVDQQREYDIQQRLEWLATEQHGQRWDEDGDEVEHGGLPDSAVEALDEAAVI